MRKYKIGKEHLSLPEIARRHGIALGVLQYRVKQKGMSLAIAVSRPVKQATTYTLAGKTMTLPEWSRETGISTGTLHDRLTLHRWPLERALTEPILTAAQRHLQRRNAKLVARMLTGLSTKPLQDHTPQRPDQTGGRSPTFSTVQRTGAVSHETYFEGTSA